MLAPLPPAEWSPERAAHLLSRAGFGGTPDQIRALHARGLDGAVASLFAARDARPAPPEWRKEPGSLKRQSMMDLKSVTDIAQRRAAFKEARQEERRRLMELRTWWLERMRLGGQPLVEKMTLFWHGHFATSVRKVGSAWAMWRQNETLRENALGNFRAMLRAMARDPAMIRWLDLQQSKVGAPNENFARELMELFTLGVGHYSEDDVKAGARAFTGNRVNPQTFEFVFGRKVHDFGVKKYLGREGKFDGDGAIDVILEQPQCARFVAGRIWEFFAYENPEPAQLDAAALTFFRSGYDVSALLGELFRSQAFYSKRAMRTHIKSPVEWLVQACVDLEIELPRQPALDVMLAQLGQSLFQPPNVRGWEGGRAWISTSTLVLRYNLSGYLVGSDDPAARRLFPPRLVTPPDLARIAPAELRKNPEAFADSLAWRLYGTESLRGRALAAVTDAGQPTGAAQARAILQRLMSTPDYQLS